MTANTASRIIGVVLISLTVTLTPVKGGENMTFSEPCIKTYTLTRDKSPWLGFTSSYEEEAESKKIRAESLADAGYEPIPLLEKYSVNRKYLIGRNEKLRRVAVDSMFFSELRRGDATRSSSGRFLVGIYKDKSFKSMKPDVLAEFLLEAQIVNTFWHVESRICLVSENNTQDSYIARYKGKHIYFTNSENEGPLDFTITIDKKTGEIFLEAR